MFTNMPEESDEKFGTPWYTVALDELTVRVLDPPGPSGTASVNPLALVKETICPSKELILPVAGLWVWEENVRPLKLKVGVME
jgi:hypothetical protein